MIVARLITMFAEWMCDWQPAAVLWTSYLSIASVGVLVVALIWVYYESRFDKALHEELGQKKPSAGLLIAGTAIASAMLLASQLEEDPVQVALVVVVSFAALWLLTFGIASLLRYGMADLEENLQAQFGLRALLVRVALLIVIVLQSSLLLALDADQLDLLWGRFSPFPDSGTPFLACMLGVLAPFALNLLVPFQIANARLHHNLRTNSLERLFYRAAVDSSLVQVTLSDGKVYVGWIDRLPPDPASTDAYLQLLPITSGYRHKETKKVVFTTHYDEIYENEAVDLYDFLKILPIANIESAGTFQQDVYLMFVQSESPNVEPPADPALHENDPLPRALA